MAKLVANGLPMMKITFRFSHCAPVHWHRVVSLGVQRVTEVWSNSHVRVLVIGILNIIMTVILRQVLRFGNNGLSVLNLNSETLQILYSKIIFREGQHDKRSGA